MNKTQLITKIEKRINILTDSQNIIMDKKWNELPKELKNVFNDENTYNVVLKLKEFVDNDIEIKKQELENRNIVYSILLYNFKIYESLLKNFELLNKDNSLNDIIKRLKN